MNTTSALVTTRLASRYRAICGQSRKRASLLETARTAAARHEHSGDPAGRGDGACARDDLKPAVATTRTNAKQPRATRTFTMTSSSAECETFRFRQRHRQRAS